MTLRHTTAFIALAVILASASAQEAKNPRPPESAPVTHVSIAFSGESIMDRGLLGAVSKYIFDHRTDRACQSFEAVHATQLPLVTSGGFPRRSQEDNVRDDVHELWEVTMCGKKQSDLVRFAFLKDGSISYWVSPTQQ